MTRPTKEGSTVATSLKGFSAPFGVRVIKRKRKSKENNVSKPYGEPELFENAVALTLLQGTPIEEVVKKVANRWAVIDDKTGAKIGSYDEREKAWEKQRLVRKQKKQKRQQKSASSPKPKSHATAKTAPKSKTAPKAKVSKEQILNQFKSALTKILREGSMISYVFEQNPGADDTLGWEKFISKLSKETVMSDPKLKGILQSVAKSEAKILSLAVNSIKDVLESAGPFQVEQKGVGQDETGDIAMNFVVGMEETGKTLPFAVKIENGRPLILFPEESRNILNSLGTDDSKLLRAELMHAQETVLDNMVDVVNATQKRDDYLKNMEGKLDRVVSGMGPLEVAMLRHLLKNKYKRG